MEGSVHPSRRCGTIASDGEASAQRLRAATSGVIDLQGHLEVPYAVLEGLRQKMQGMGLV